MIAAPAALAALVVAADNEDFKPIDEYRVTTSYMVSVSPLTAAIWILLAIGVAYVARRSGRGPIRYFVLSLLCTPIIGATVLSWRTVRAADKAHRDEQSRPQGQPPGPSVH